MNHNKIVLFLKLGLIWSAIIIISFLYEKYIVFISSEPFSYTSYEYSAISAFISTVAILIIYKSVKNDPQVIEYDIEGISKRFLFFDYYSRLLPSFIVFFSIALMIISDLYPIILAFLGIMFFSIGLAFAFFVFIIFYNYKVGLNLNYDISCMIFTKYICNQEKIDYFYIKKLSTFFENCLKDIDSHLYKGIKIKNIKVETDDITIKKIILYLTPYIKYGSSEEKQSLMKNFKSIKSCIHEDNSLKSLKITEGIIKIYQDEKTFLSKYNYNMEPDSPLVRFYDDTKNHLFLIIIIFFFLIFIVNIKYSEITPLLQTLQSDSVIQLIEPIISLAGALIGAFATIIAIIITYYINTYKNK